MAAEVSPEDGLDPREYFRAGKSARRPNRKALQLCGQVADALNQILSGECGDEVLRSLQVLSVTPAPDASQLMVLVAPTVDEASTPPGETLARLDRASGMLRTLIAEVVTRRRAPRLLFRVVAGGEERS